MKLKLVAPRQGMVWVRQGLQAFARRPFAFCLLLFVYMLVGPLLMLTVAPLTTIAFMIATRDTLQGKFPFLTAFIEPLRASAPQRWAQIQLGIAYAVGISLVFWLSDAVGGSALDALRAAVSAGKTTPHDLEPLLADPKLQAGWLLLAAGIALMAVPFWHAPALVHWGGYSAVKSLFFSTVACWRNKGALAVYSLGWSAVIIVFSLVVNVLFALFGIAQLAFVVLTPALLVVSAAFYASLYFTFADSFESPTLELPTGAADTSW